MIINRLLRDPELEQMQDTKQVKAELTTSASLLGSQGYTWNGRAYTKDVVSTVKQHRSLPSLLELTHPRYSTGAIEYEWEQSKYNRRKG